MDKPTTAPAAEAKRHSSAGSYSLLTLSLRDRACAGARVTVPLSVPISTGFRHHREVVIREPTVGELGRLNAGEIDALELLVICSSLDRATFARLAWADAERVTSALDGLLPDFAKIEGNR